MKTYSLREFEKILKKNGFYLDRTSKHKVYKHKDGRTVALSCTSLNKVVCQRLIKENNLEL